MRKMMAGLALLVIITCLAAAALAEGSAISINSTYPIDGQTYGGGYVPVVSGDTLRVVLPLQTSDAAIASIRVSPRLDVSGNSPFMGGNYAIELENQGNQFLFDYTFHLKSQRVNGSYPLVFEVAYEQGGAPKAQDFTVYVNITDGRDPGWPEPTPLPTQTPVAGQLSIDSRGLYPGMEKTYAQGYVPLVIDGRVYIILPLLGQTYDNRVTITANLGELQDSPFVYGNYSQTVGGGDAYVFGLEIPLAKTRYNGTYPVELRADYLDAAGMQASQTFTVYVTITDGKTPPDPNDLPPQEVERPELFISACTVNPDTVGGEESFTVALAIENLGAIRARSVRLTYGSEAAGIIPVETNNALHLENIASADTATATFQLQTTKDVLAGNQPFYVTLDYVDLYGGIYTSTRTFLIRVTRPASMRYDAVALPKEVTAGETVSLPANVFNVGKSTLRNVTVTLEGAGLFPTSSVFLGDILPGEAGYGEMKVFIGMLSMTEGYTESYGLTKGTYTVSYEDDFGTTHTEEAPVTTEIKQPVIEGEKTDAEKKAEEERQKAIGQWWISVLVAFAIIAIIVTVIIVTKFTRMMRMK